MVPTTRDFSVKFGRTHELGLESQKAFPFVYTFINSNDDAWAASAGQPSMAHIGPLVPAGQTVSKNVLLDPDYNFKLLAIKYTAYYWNSRSSYYEWYENAVATEETDPDFLKIGTPLSRYVRISLSLQGSGSTILYGGPHNNPVIPAASVNGRLPLPLEAAQGYDSGHYTLRTPYLLPREAIMVFDITNDHATKNLYVGAAIYGMKIRI